MASQWCAAPSLFPPSVARGKMAKGKPTAGARLPMFADVVAVGEAEDSLGGAVRGALLDLDDVAVHVAVARCSASVRE